MTSSLVTRQARRQFMVTALAWGIAACQSTPALRPEGAIPTPQPGAQKKVALIVPLTGLDGPIGTSISRAAALALTDTGNQQITLTVFDSAKAGAASAATLALANGNALILGPLTADDVRAVAPLARKAGVPVVAFSNDRDVAGDGVFIMGTAPADSIDRAVQYARGKGAARFGGIVPTNLYGQRVSQALLTAVQRSGGKMGGIQAYGQTAASMRTAVAALNSRGPMDAVIIGDSVSNAAVAAPGIRTGQRIIGTELWGNERTIGKTPALRGAWYAALPNDRFDQLVTRYRAKYGKTPYRLASLGYDAMLLTVRTERFWTAGTPFPVRKLLEKDGFTGVDGIFRFGRDGIAERALEVRQVTATGSTLLSPAAATFAN